MRLPVLILGAEPRVVVTIARSLAKCGIPVVVASFMENDHRVSSRAIHRFVRLPNAEEHPDVFFGELCRLIREMRCDTLIPSNDTALTVISGYYSHLSSALHICCPAPHIVRRVLEKDLTLMAAKDCGISVPFTYNICTLNDLDAMSDGLRFPLIGKPKSKKRPGNFKIQYYQDFKAIEEAFKADHEFGAHTLIQDYCSGDGVGIETLIHKGDPIALFQHCRVREYPDSGGVSVTAVSEEVNPFLAEQALSPLRALEWEGIAMVEFRYDSVKRTSALMEVNGRYYGSLSLSSHAGLDFPLYEWQIAHNETPQPPDAYTVRMKWRWTAGHILRTNEALVRAGRGEGTRSEVIKSIGDCLKEITSKASDALWDVRDPVPAISELFVTIRHTIALLLKQHLKKMIPKRLLRYYRAQGVLEGKERSSYLRLLVLRSLRGLAFNKTQDLGSKRSILFICHGNIIRSPMAEALLKKHLLAANDATVTVASAGLHAKPGRMADSRSMEIAKEYGISLEDHKARLITKGMIDAVDAIFVMDFVNEAKMEAQYPGSRNRTYMLGGISRNGACGQVEIPDPYHGGVSEIRHCYTLIDSCTKCLAQLLLPCNDSVDE